MPAFVEVDKRTALSTPDGGDGRADRALSAGMHVQRGIAPEVVARHEGTPELQGFAGQPVAITTIGTSGVTTRPSPRRSSGVALLEKFCHPGDGIAIRERGICARHRPARRWRRASVHVLAHGPPWLGPVLESSPTPALSVQAGPAPNLPARDALPGHPHPIGGPLAG